MYTRLLVPLDGSALAETALPYAEALAALTGGTLYLVRAAPPDEQAAALAYLQQVAQRLQAQGMSVEPRVLTGPAAEAIAYEALRCQADLMVLATHGRTGIARWVLGSVADALLHQIATPCLLVRPGQRRWEGRPRRVLVPLDGSELAERALEPATALAAPEGELLLYQVLPPAAATAADLEHDPTWSEILEEIRAEVLRYLERVAERLRTAGYRVRTATDYGEPAACIADCARREEADLIVLSSHGRSGLARWLLGSVADALVRRAPVPLLLLRPLLAARPAAPERQPAAEAPPITLELSGQEVALLRLALETLLARAGSAPGLAPALRALLARLPAPMAMGEEPSPTGTAAAAPPAPSPPAPGGALVDPATIQPGDVVYAHHVDSQGRTDIGQYVGIVREVLRHDGVHYLHVHGGLGQANELFIPLSAVRAVAGKQVHLTLTLEDLAGLAWHLPPGSPGRA
jgi:nucleotide-binding universal stress UspA family protein